MSVSVHGLKAGKRASDVPGPAPVRLRRDLVLEAAIAAGEPSLLFQPQIETRTGRVVGAEALVRWSGEGDAQALFARAERCGLSERLSRHVQRQALRAAAQWAGPLAGLNFSINLLPDDLSRNGYEQWLLQEIGAAGLDPARLTVEITESAMVVDDRTVAERLSVLRREGIRVAVDDFGTGYASLAYLTRLPLDVLKVDRGLIADIVAGRRDGIVVRALIRLARELELQLLVEGVESADQLALLAEWGVERYQGFIGARALSEPELARFVGASNRAAA
jgi:EAL domain-containing protein (putative c-di-GMP-specific phosphodiesterase class I)